MRVAATHAQIDTCDVFWVVSHIDRAITNTTIDGLLGNYAKRFKGNIALILTRSDSDLSNPRLAQHYEKEKCNLEPYRLAMVEHQHLRKSLNQSMKKLADRQAILAKLAGQQKLDEYALVVALQADVDSIHVKIRNAGTQRASALADIRNEYITRRVQEETAAHMPEGVQLPVFCISNLHYTQGQGTQSEDILSSDATGIPRLQRYLFEMIAPKAIQRIEDFINHQCQVNLNGLGLWAHCIAIDSAGDLITDPWQEAKPDLEQYMKAFDLALSATISKLSHSKDALTNARKVIETKRDWHWTTIKAFIRKGGNYRTAIVPRESWNEQFLEPVNRIVDAEWSNLLASQKESLDTVENKCKQGISKISRQLRGKYTDPRRSL